MACEIRRGVGGGYLFKEEVKHKNEAAQVHVIILVVQVQSTVPRGMAQIPEGATVQRASEGAWEWTKCALLPSTTWV